MEWITQRERGSKTLRDSEGLRTLLTRLQADGAPVGAPTLRSPSSWSSRLGATRGWHARRSAEPWEAAAAAYDARQACRNDCGGVQHAPPFRNVSALLLFTPFKYHREGSELMDEENFDESRRNGDFSDVNEGQVRHPRKAAATPHAERQRATASGRPARPAVPGKRRRSGIEWVRTSDLISIGTGHIAGLGIDLVAELARRTRRAPVTAVRRVVGRRADRLPPPSQFGQSRSYPQSSRPGPTRD